MGQTRADDDVRAEVLRFVREMNDAWTIEGRPDRLGDYFHEEMVAVAAGVPGRLEGRDVCVAGWTAYARTHEILSWAEDDVDVRLFAGDETAVVNYEYRIRFRSGEREYEERGRDTMTLVREAGRWWLAADHFSSR